MSAVELLEQIPEVYRSCNDNYGNIFMDSAQYSLRVDNYEGELMELEEEHKEVGPELNPHPSMFNDPYIPNIDPRNRMIAEENDHDSNDTSVIVFHQNEEKLEFDWQQEESSLQNHEVFVNLPEHSENYLGPEAFLDFNQPIPKLEFEDFGQYASQCNNNCYQPTNVIASPVWNQPPTPVSTAFSEMNSTRDEDVMSVDDVKPKAKKIPSSTKQDGTLAFLRQCILEIRAGIDILFTNREEHMKMSLWNYLMKISKKAEIQKQPKKKIKFLLICTLDQANVFEGLDLESSNLIRKKIYSFIRNKIDTKQFENNFYKHRNYGKIDKQGRERDRLDADNKILNTLQQYFEELKKPSRFRGLYSDPNYTPDLEWIRSIEMKGQQSQVPTPKAVPSQEKRQLFASILPEKNLIENANNNSIIKHHYNTRRH
jgi:hypothetical protein